MRESALEIDDLQNILDASISTSTAHLRDIISGDTVLTATDITAATTGMKVISVATVTASGEPRISGLDGHFLHGSWTFGSSASAAKARHIAARPAVSVAHIDGERVAVYSHGIAVRLQPGDADFEDTVDHWTKHYGQSPLTFDDDVVLWKLLPQWMVGYAADRAGLRTGTEQNADNA